MNDASAIFASPRLTITLEALARAYDHMVMDGGAISETPVSFFAALAPRAVLVANNIASAETQNAREQLNAAGFADVVCIQGGAGQSSTEPVAA
jgi:precorrin-6B methylase 2